METFRKYVSPLFGPSDFQKLSDVRSDEERLTLLKAMQKRVENIDIPPIPEIASEKIRLFSSLQHGLCLFVTVEEYQIERRWLGRSCFDVKSLAASEPSLTLPANRRHIDDMRILGLRSGLKPEKDEAFQELYLRLEGELLRKEVAFPNSGFSFRVEQSIWLSNLVVILLLVVLHDRIGHVLRGGNLGRGEPWLVLDAKDPIAKGVARLWCLAIGIGPWL